MFLAYFIFVASYLKMKPTVYLKISIPLTTLWWKGDIDQFLFFDYKKIYIRNQFSFQKFRFKNVINFCYSHVLTRVKKNKISKCRALGCTNQADKNSNIITLLTIIKMLL